MSEGYIVAVSGGVDSVVLLDMMVRTGKYRLIVAHFDHGIRADSADDARFVEALAKKYGLPFFSRREELGEKASEEQARKRRYMFLRQLAAEHKATIVTAHHADDVIETIAINSIRGTSWRGLAVLDAQDIERPLIAYRKSELYDYAVRHKLEWGEDSTNISSRYLRNRLRKRLFRLSDKARSQLFSLRQDQQAVKAEIDAEATRLLALKTSFSRYFFINIETNSAIELLRTVVFMQTGRHLLRSQIERGILAIKTAMPGTRVQLGEGIELAFTKTSFIALRGEKMI